MKNLVFFGFFFIASHVGANEFVRETVQCRIHATMESVIKRPKELPYEDQLTIKYAYIKPSPAVPATTPIPLLSDYTSIKFFPGGNPDIPAPREIARILEHPTSLERYRHGGLSIAFNLFSTEHTIAWIQHLGSFDLVQADKKDLSPLSRVDYDGRYLNRIEMAIGLYHDDVCYQTHLPAEGPRKKQDGLSYHLCFDCQIVPNW